MRFLKTKFFDKAEYIDQFLGAGNTLHHLEKPDVFKEEVKKAFVKQFTDELVKKGILNEGVISAVDDMNAWSIDFPSWFGGFDEHKGKKIMVVGSEPHIHNKYLQTVYGLHSGKPEECYLGKEDSIFQFLTEILSVKFKISTREVLQDCYLTDLFPLGPMRTSKTKVGSAGKIQSLLGELGSWPSIRRNFASISLPKEIDAVNPEVIICQGKTVFYEVVKILEIDSKRLKVPITTTSGKRQYIRMVNWNNRKIIAVPHIGSRRMKTFWKNNLSIVKQALAEIPL